MTTQTAVNLAETLSESRVDRRRHIDLIMCQIESLPTLPVVATRLLSLTADDKATARQVIDLVSSDPVLTAKVISLCRGADTGVRQDDLTVGRAVVLLGFAAVRNAVLSVKVMELFDNDRLGQSLDRSEFWRHSIAVAIAAELIAGAHGSSSECPASEAFVCGLLHDLGKLALDYVLPRSYARVIELTELNQGNIADFERRIIGIDHHTAGKRLAEHWHLPYEVQDCLWLHGSTYEMLPRLDHKRLIGVVSLADLIVRRHHVGYSGNFSMSQEVEVICDQIDFDSQKIDSITRQLFEEIPRRCDALGLDDVPSPKLFVRSLQRANEALGRLNRDLGRRSHAAARQERILDAIVEFHHGAVPGRSIQDVIDKVVRSAATVLDANSYTVLRQSDPIDPETRSQRTWMISRHHSDGESLDWQYVDPLPHWPDLSQLELNRSVTTEVAGCLSEIRDLLGSSADAGRLRVIPLVCGWGIAAVLLHDGPRDRPFNELHALAAVWGAAIASAAQHDGARRLGEDLAEANRVAAQAHERLLQHESMARLGEMAAGAAHEMNNPLAVISGRSQMLCTALPEGSKQQLDAQAVLEQTRSLSDMITSLHRFAEPNSADRCCADVTALLKDTIARVRDDANHADHDVSVQLQIKNDLSRINLDRDQIGGAVRELLLNAMQALPKRAVQVVAGIDSTDQCLVIHVVDDGEGMDSHVLSHATDPFFSAKSAGRRAGMGLPRARQWVAAHDGELVLQSTPGKGTSAVIRIPIESESE